MRRRNVTPTGQLNRRAQRAIEAATVAASKQSSKIFGDMYVHAVTRAAHGEKQFLEFMKHLKQVPVDIETFLDSEEFMGSTDLSLWPEVRRAIVNMNKYWWKGPGHAYNGANLCGATGCVDKDTEYLTPTGWKKISEYKEGEQVAQYHSDGTVDFVTPKAYVKMEYDHFLQFKTRDFDQLLTPGHRVIYKALKTGQLQEKPAEEVAQIHNRSGNGWKSGLFIGDFKAGGEGIDLSDDHLKLMTAITLAATREPGKYRYTIDTYKEPQKLRLRNLLTACGITFIEEVKGIKHTAITFETLQYVLLSANWWGCSNEQLQLIADECMKWSGDELKQEIYTDSKEVADYVQYALSATERRCSLLESVDEQGVTHYTVKVAAARQWRLCTQAKDKPMIVPVPSEDGYCYCFTLESGMWVSRRNGLVVVTGNTGKSEIAKVTTAYHMHILGCLKEPQKLYGLPSATSIVMVIQAAKPHVTKKVVYAPLRNYIETMPWFQKHMRPDKLLESEMYFPHMNLRVVQGGSDTDAILGEAIISAIIDEINFMNVVEKSKRAGVGTGRSGTYDQAQAVYDAVSSRRKGRFLYNGPQIGMIIASSSTRYKGDFTDRLSKQIVDTADDPRAERIYEYNKAQYEVKPAEGRYSGETFIVWVGNDAVVDIRIIKDGQEPPPRGQRFEVPIEYLPNFERDPAGSMRDIIGRSVNAVNPFFRQRNKIMECIQIGEELGLESFLTKDNVVLAMESMPMPERGHFCRNPSKPRYVHIDLSNTGDRCGIAMVRFDGMEFVGRMSDNEELLPVCTLEMAVSIEPDHNAEIDIAEVRMWVKLLKSQYGYPIRAVTYDGWNSLESRQAWKKAGMKTGVLSVDRTSVPYKNFRDAIYDGRVRMYHQEVLVGELFELEYDDNKDKIDHPVGGSKDVADAACGAYYNMLSRSSSWHLTGESGGVERYDEDHRNDMPRPN